MGFPGELTALVTYRVDATSVDITLEATTDTPTVVNLTNHTYWNLDGAGGTVDGHLLTVDADQFTPVDATGIPLGEHESVEGTPFDLRQPTLLGPAVRAPHAQTEDTRGIDHNYVMKGAGPRDAGVSGAGMRRIAVLEARTRLELWSDQPGLQVYTGNNLDGTTRSIDGLTYRQGDGIALEPQRFPDTPRGRRPGSTPGRPTARRSCGGSDRPDRTFVHASGVRHFDFLTDPAREALFAVPPQPVDRAGPPAALALALGATFYSPGTRPDLPADARRAASIGTTSHVWCLEDAVPHDAVPEAQANVVRSLRSFTDDEHLPLLFVRVRTPEQLLAVVRQAGEATRHLTGFVLPKFLPGDPGLAWMQALEQAGPGLYGMPVLEDEDLAWAETRGEHLAGIRALLDAHRDQVLSVRVGATDLSGLFGLRRDADTTIWDVAVVRDMLSHVLNVFARRGDYIVSGPVWEHFSGDRLFKSQLRETPFATHRSQGLRQRLLAGDTDELLREVTLDRANGFVGKTVIHPTHVNLVNAMSAVFRDEHDDALAVLAGRGAGGLVASPSGGKMNELGPHELWAEQVSARAAVYGVLAEADGVVQLLDAGWRVAQQAYGTSPSSSPSPATS